jgi:hypothetical protein
MKQIELIFRTIGDIYFSDSIRVAGAEWSRVRFPDYWPSAATTIYTPFALSAAVNSFLRGELLPGGWSFPALAQSNEDVRNSRSWCSELS